MRGLKTEPDKCRASIARLDAAGKDGRGGRCSRRERRARAALVAAGALVLAVLLGTGCERDADAVAACVHRCRASGGRYLGVLPEFPHLRESLCRCEFPIEFVDGGAR